MDTRHPLIRTMVGMLIQAGLVANLPGGNVTGVVR
jgi:hypothetical protein